MNNITNAVNNLCNRILSNPEELLRQVAWVLARRNDLLRDFPQFLEDELRPHVAAAKKELAERQANL